MERATASRALPECVESAENQWTRRWSSSIRMAMVPGVKVIEEQRAVRARSDRSRVRKWTTLGFMRPASRSSTRMKLAA